MENGVSSFVSPSPKPVFINHDHDNSENAIGEIIESKYVSYESTEASLFDSEPDSVYESVIRLISSDAFRGKD